MKQDGTLAELVPASGGSWGGTCIDKAFKEFLTNLFGKSVMNIFQKDSEYLEDYFDFWQHFEVKKRAFENEQNESENKEKKKDNPESKFAIRIPFALGEIVAKQSKQGFKQTKMDAVIANAIEKSHFKNAVSCTNGKLLMQSSFFKQMFDPTIKLLINHLKKLYTDIGEDLKVILMVGGFSECSVIQDAVKKELQSGCS